MAHPLFADWYRAVSIEHDHDRLVRRWTGVDMAVNSMDRPATLEVARLALGMQHADQPRVDAFRAHFKTADESFPMLGNDAELRVLATASLIHLFETQRTWNTDAGALAVLCGTARGMGAKPQVGQLLTSARSYLAKEALLVRDARDDSEAPPEPGLAKQIDTVVEAAAEGGQKLAEQLKAVLEPIEAELKHLRTRTDALTASLDTERERSEMLWWLLGEFSNERQVPLRKLPMPGACLIVAKDLITLSHFNLRPYAADAFLSRALHAVEPKLRATTSLLLAVNDTPEDWRRSLVSGVDLRESAGLCPVLTAVQRSVEFEAQDWPAAYRRGAGIDPAQPLAPLDLAGQLCDELDLLKTLAVR